MTGGFDSSGRITSEVTRKRKPPLWRHFANLIEEFKTVQSLSSSFGENIF
jgi:hypothetical protein